METQTEPVESDVEVTPEEDTREVPIETAPEERPAAEPRQTRQERKSKRLDVESAQKERDELRRTLESERAERQRTEREWSEKLGEINGRLSEVSRSTQQVDKQAETKSKIGELRKQAKFHLFLSAKAQDQATADKEWDEHKRLEDAANDLRDDMRDEARWEKRRGEISSSLPDPAVQNELAFMNAKFPWLEGSQEAQALADGRMRALVKQGRPATRETAIEAITYAGQRLGLGGNGTAATPGQRALYAGIPSGEGAGSGGDNRKTIKMGRDEEALARAAYSHLEAKDAYKQWAKDITARMSDKDE